MRDRGVGNVRHNPETALGVGFEFFDIRNGGHKRSPQRARKKSYRINATDPVKVCVVQLTDSDGNARHFKQAEWRFMVDDSPEGASVSCAAHFKFQFKLIFLAPVFFVMRGAIHRDLESLRRVLENA